MKVAVVATQKTEVVYYSIATLEELDNLLCGMPEYVMTIWSSKALDIGMAFYPLVLDADCELVLHPMLYNPEEDTI